MFATSDSQRAGLLAAIITGGRPGITERTTAKYIPFLRAAGVADVVWVLSDKDAPNYERDSNPLCVYEQEWAYEYARTHWMNPDPPDPDAFLGAFPGREWACLEAERRGCWGVLQLDDNIDRLSLHRATTSSFRVIREAGSLGFHTDLLAAMVLSTNAWMVGAALESVNPSQSDVRKLIRPGFPYSCFIERVGEGREEWYGPFEDDITHAFQYGDRADGATAALMPAIRYHKENKSKTGMRKAYNQMRSVQLQRLMPQGAKLSVRATRSNGRGTPRVFHTLAPGAIRNPIVVRDRDLYRRAHDRVADLTKVWVTGEYEANRAKVRRRLIRAGGA